jgi:hypothetical protein
VAALKLTSFFGIAPKIASELLPDTAAQIAKNVKLDSGDLIPYPQGVAAGSAGQSGTIKTIYPLRDPINNSLKWLSWLTDVNVAVGLSNEDNDQRFYYTGAGVPKASDYTLATTGSTPYPVSFYTLGLPVPTTKPSVSTTAFTTKTSASFARDASGIATLVTGTPHGLRTGSVVTVSGFVSISGTYVQSGTSTITVTINNHGLPNGASVPLNFTSGLGADGTFVVSNVATNTFDITSSVSATTSGTVELDIRSFNITNIEINVVNSTTFNYSSPGFQVSTTTNTTGKIDLGGFNQVRTYAYSWYTPWEEESIASDPSNELILKEGQVVTVTNLPSAKPSGNNFVRGIRLYRTIPSASGTKYFRLNTFWFPVNLTKVERAGNIAQVTTQFPHNFSIDDRFKISNCTVGSFNITGGIVTNVLSDFVFEYANPGADEFPTPVGAGTVYYDVSQTPGTSTAQYWGDGGVYTFTDDFNASLLLDELASDEYEAPPEDLKGLVVMQNNVFAGFVANQIYFSEPNLPHAWPRSYVVTIEHDIVGLAVVSGSLLVLTESYPYIIQGSDPAAGFSAARIDLQYPCLNARSIVTLSGGVVWSTYDGLAFYSPYAGAQLVTKFNYDNDSWSTGLNPSTVIATFFNDKYIASHSAGGFTFTRDEKIGGMFVTLDQIFTAVWFDSIGGKLYYVAGNTGVIYEWDNLSQPNLTVQWKSKTFKTKDMINLGAGRVIADYNGGSLTFKLYVNKNLTLTRTVTDSNTFRMPSGYRSDTFEFEVESNIRVREVHLAETPIGLKEA